MGGVMPPNTKHENNKFRTYRGRIKELIYLP